MAMVPAVTRVIDAYRSGVMRSFKTKIASNAPKTIEVSRRAATGAMGALVMVMVFVTQLPIAIVLMIAVGALAGFFVVPMNALLQHRGHILMGAGHSIAVQNFNENLSILVMTTIYSLLIKADLHIYWIIAMFGLFVAGTMYFVKKRHEANQRQYDDVAHLDDAAHH